MRDLEGELARAQAQRRRTAQRAAGLHEYAQATTGDLHAWLSEAANNLDHLAAVLDQHAAYLRAKIAARDDDTPHWQTTRCTRPPLVKPERSTLPTRDYPTWLGGRH